MLIGNYVGLRAIEKKDLPQLLTWRNDSNLRKYFREYRILSSAHQENWYNQKALGDSNTVMFAIVDFSDKSLIGCCGLCYIDWINRNADFSLYIGKNHLYADKKYGKDAAIQLLNYGFNELNLHRIYVEIFKFDKIKLELIKDLKFFYEGESRDKIYCKGEWHNCEHYAILSDEWFK